jgi:uncharacterized membrane protein YbhN (UPF0104 family)
VVLPIIISGSLLGGLIGFAGGGRFLSTVARFRPIFLLPFVGLMVVYEVVRVTQWHVLLRHVGIRPSWRTETLSYMGGETAKYVPVGTFAQNYVLLQARGTDVGLSSSATTAIILIEPVAALLITGVLGIDGWVWLRPTIFGGGALAALLAWTLHRRGAHVTLPDWLARSTVWRRVEREARSFRTGMKRMADVPLLLGQLGLALLYVALGGVGLYLVVMALGARVAPGAAIAAYSFGVAVALVVPIMTDLGSLEVSSAAALAAAGLALSRASAAVMVDRALVIAVPVVFSLILAAIWPDLTRRILSPRRPEAPAEERRAAAGRGCQ